MGLELTPQSFYDPSQYGPDLSRVLSFRTHQREIDRLIEDVEGSIAC